MLAGLGGAGAVAAPLLAIEMTGSMALAGIPLALLVVGSSAAVMPVTALSRRHGRRVGLSLSLLLAAFGALGVVAGGALGSFALVCVAILPFGAGNTAVMLARYAAADLSAPAQRGRAIGSVVFATTAGAVAGPNLLSASGRVAGVLALPAATGLFLVSAISFVAAAVVLLALFRPDPVRAAAQPSGGVQRPGRPLAPHSIVGLATIAVANLVMVSLMAMAPVEMHAGGHDLRLVGLVVSLHIAGMFAPAPLTGWLTDRVGPLRLAPVAVALLTVAGLVLAGAGSDATAFTVGVLLLGVGWNVALVAGSALLVADTPASDRPRIEGIGELSMGVAAGSGTALAGPLMGAAGYAALALVGAIAAAALAPLMLVAARRGVATTAAPAPRLLT